MEKLHPTQKRLLSLLQKHIDDPLTVRELQDALDVSSTSVVQHHINRLIDKGLLLRNPSNPLDYQVISDDPEKSVALLNVYGMAQCGPQGSILDGNPVDKVKISTKLLGFSASEAFAVKARGTSMLPKIHAGDLVIAKKATVPEDGAIVVCVNNGETLIKKLQIIYSGKSIPVYNLISLNDKEFPPFVASDDFKVEGIVRSVLSYSM